MREISKNLLTILGAVLVFMVGVGLGFWLRSGVVLQVAPATEFENKVVESIFFSVIGRVIRIEEQEITLEQEGDPFSFKVGEDALIQRFKAPPLPEDTEPMPEGDTPPVAEKIALEDIKIGDRISANVEKIGQEGFVARGITVIAE